MKRLDMQKFALTGPEASIQGGTTMRNTNLPENGNTALHVCQNESDIMACRHLLEEETLPLKQWILPWQKHTAAIQCVTKKQAGAGAFDKDTSILETDGLYTTDKDVLLGVFTADCLGIAFGDAQHGVVGAVHSGWKGTAQAITWNFLQALQTDGLLYPDSMHVWFSPSLMPQSLEVGPEVVAAIETMCKEKGLDASGCITPGQGDRSFLDNQQVNVQMLKAFGIPEENIHTSSLDTKTNEDCFSFRRDGKKTGEHFTWIYQS